MAETVLERTLEGRDHWAILVFCGGGVGEQVTHALLPWQAHWEATNPATAYALAAGLINGARQLGAGWRAFAAVDGRTGQVMSGPR